MMEVKFFQQTTKPFGKRNVETMWAETFCVGNEIGVEPGESLFEETNFQIGDILVFSSRYSKSIADIVVEIREIISKHTSVEVILVCSCEYFKQIIKNTNSKELVPNVLITKGRDILYYSIIGADGCALLVAYEVLGQED